MTPHRLGLGRPVLDPASTGESPQVHRARSTRAAVTIVVMLAFITVLHLFTEPAADALPVHLLYRRLYFVPVIYAAWVFGRRGGLAAGMSAALAFGVHTHVSGAFASFDTWLEVASYVILGLLFGVLRDIEGDRSSDLRQVSTQLEDAYRKLEERAIQLINVQDYTASILRSITSGVITVGPDGSVTTANPAAERMLGQTEGQMVPKSIARIVKDDAGVADDVAKVLSGRVPLTLRDATLMTRSGRPLHVQVSTSRMRSVGGGVLGAVVTFEDVSDIQALTDQLIRADRLAAMGELTAGVAHEVRNPLGVIRASVQLLEDAECDPDRIGAAATVIKQEIDRLDKVIKALLDFGRPSRPTLIRTDLNRVLDDIALFTNRFAKMADVVITVEPMDGLPQVMGDPDQLKQVFLNLVTNAVQAMGERGGNIHIRAMHDQDYVTVTVSDTGPGIDKADLAKVFDPFFTKRSGGTGLGLTIVHRIIDQHDGHIGLESSERGTTFTVSLPVAYETTGAERS